MKFSNLCIYRIRPEALPNLETLESALREQPFAPCGATEPQRVGWVPALDDERTGYVHSAGQASGTWLLRLREQRRLLPAGVIREQLEEQVRSIQDKEVRKLGKKEIARLKDELMFTLLPRAFTKTGDTLAVILPADGLILVGAASLSRAELVLNSLRLALGSLPVERPAFNSPVPSNLTDWVSDRQPPVSFGFGDRVELADDDAVIQCKGIDVGGDESQAGISIGREVRKLSLVFEDSLSFVLLPDFRLAGMRLTERLRGDLDAQYSGDKLANLQAESALWVMQLRTLVPALLAACGEETQ